MIDQSEQFEIDIHGLNKSEAEKILKGRLKNLPNAIKEIIVIHGYKHGTSLSEYVRYHLDDRRIERKLYFDNLGRTSLFLSSLRH